MNLEQLKTVFVKITWNDAGEKTVVFLEKWSTATIKTQEQIETHFKNANAGIAIVTGKESNLTVIDFDTKSDEMLSELMATCPTYCVETKKGYHLYYQYKDDHILKQGTERFSHGVDVRSDGGLVFAPPTPNYKVWGDEGVNELNDEALEILKQRSTPKKQIGNLKTTTTRNDSLFRMACGWIDHYPEQEVWSRMVKANRDFHKGELDLTELDIIFQQAKKYKKGEPVEEEIKILHIEDIALEQRKEMSLAKSPTGFKVLDEVFEGGLRAGNAVIIAALAGEGKTALMQTLSYHYSKQGITSLWFSYEETMSEIWERFEKMGVDKSYQLFAPFDLEDSKIDLIEKVIIQQKNKTPFFVVFIDQLFNLFPKLDGKARLDHLSTNHSLYLGQMSTQLKAIAMQQKIIVVTAHQLNRAGELSYSDMVRHAPDKVLYLKREESTVSGLQPFTDKTFLKINKNRPYGTRPIIPLSVVDGRFVPYGTADLTAQAERLLINFNPLL